MPLSLITGCKAFLLDLLKRQLSGLNIPSIAASGNTEICMYYGDSSALTTSNIHTTFIFGDDFADPTYTNAHIIAWQWRSFQSGES